MRVTIKKIGGNKYHYTYITSWEISDTKKAQMGGPTELCLVCLVEFPGSTTIGSIVTLLNDVEAVWVDEDQIYPEKSKPIKLPEL